MTCSMIHLKICYLTIMHRFSFHLFVCFLDKSAPLQGLAQNTLCRLRGCGDMFLGDGIQVPALLQKITHLYACITHSRPPYECDLTSCWLCSTDTRLCFCVHITSSTFNTFWNQPASTPLAWTPSYCTRCRATMYLCMLCWSAYNRPASPVHRGQARAGFPAS